MMHAEWNVCMKEKKRLGSNVFIYPMPMTLLGVNVSDKPNFMALG